VTFPTEENLKAQISALRTELDQAKREQDRLREALKFYGNPETYEQVNILGKCGLSDDFDPAGYGRRARVALAPHADHVPDAGQMVHTMGEWHQSEPDVKPTPFVPHEFVRVGTTESPIPQPDPLAEARRLLEDAEPRLGHSINCSRIKDWEAPCNCGLETARASIIAYLAAHPEPGK
jgi:hypothetical protein